MVGTKSVNDFSQVRIPGTKYYITAMGQVYELTVDTDGLLEDEYGGFWALNDQLTLVGDPIVRCGVGIFSLPVDHPLTPVCEIHDYAESSPEFLAFHTHEEAAIALRKLIKQTDYSFWGQTFYRLIQAYNWITGRTN